MEKIETKVGEAFDIALKGNPSTGYRWQPQFDSTLISLVDQRYESENKKTGSAGLEIFTFRALKACKTDIVMVLRRQWEKESIQREIFEVLIRQ